MKSGIEDVCLFTKFYCGVSVLIFFAMAAAGKKSVIPNIALFSWRYAFLILIAVKHKQYRCPQSCKVFWLIHLWPSTFPAGSFQGFPICFSALQNPALTQPVILTPVLRGSLRLKDGLGLIQHPIDLRKWSRKLASTDKKEHNRSSPKHHFCLSNPPNCANKSRRGVTVSVSSLPLGCSLAWPGGKIAMSRLGTLDSRSVAYLDSVTFPFLSTYLPKFLNRAWSSCRIRTCF